MAGDEMGGQDVRMGEGLHGPFLRAVVGCGDAVGLRRVGKGEVEELAQEACVQRQVGGREGIEEEHKRQPHPLPECTLDQERA